MDNSTMQVSAIKCSGERRISEYERAALLKFLKEVDHRFVPPLSSRTDLKRYLGKLLAEGFVHYVWTENGECVNGMAGFYCTPEIYDYAFLSFIATSGDTPRLGSAILSSAIDYVKASGMRGFETQTWASNTRSLAMFERAGFKIQAIEKNRGKDQVASVLLKLDF